MVLKMPITFVFLIFCYLSCNGVPQIVSSQDKIQLNKIKKLSELPDKTSHQRAGVFFIDDQIGWFFQGNNLWHSTNQGKNWLKIAKTYTPVVQEDAYAYSGSLLEANFQSIESIYFSDSKNGWIVTTKNIYHTENSGETLKKTTLLLEYILDVNYSKNGETVYVLGREEQLTLPHTDSKALNFNPCLFYSSNKGATWTKIDVPAESGAPDKISFSDKDHGWLVSPNIISKFDSGKWEISKIDHLRCGSKTAIQKLTGLDEFTYYKFTVAGFPVITTAFFLNSEIGWISLTSGEVLHTTNGGRDWCPIIEPEKIWMPKYISTDYFDEIFFDNVACGWGRDGRGGLFQIQSGGKNILLVDPSIKFENMYFKNCNQAWGVADDGIYSIK